MPAIRFSKTTVHGVLRNSVALGIMLLPAIVLGQVAAYTFTHFNGNYAQLNVLDPGLGDTNTDEQRFVDPAEPLGGSATTGPGFNMGFDFSYNGYVYDRLAVHANGWISLGHSSLTPAVDITSTGGTAPGNLGFMAATNAVAHPGHRARIGGFAADLIATPSSTLHQFTTGTTPNQVKVVQWKDYAIAGVPGSIVNFQIRLYETTNRVEIAYGTMTPTAFPVLASVGLGGNAASDFNNRTTTTSWMATTGGTNALDACTFSTGVTTPNFGRTYRWVPPTCTPPGAQAWTEDQCGNGLFYLMVALTNVGSGPYVNIVPSVGTAFYEVYDLNNYMLGPYQNGTQVSVTVQNSQQPNCALDLGSFVDCCGGHCGASIPAVIGTNHTSPMVCGSGASSPPAAGDPAVHARWFHWTAPENGLLSVSSCGAVNTGNHDTRLTIWTGSCGNLTAVAHNDDACSWANGGVEWAAAIHNLPVTQGTTYRIEWDDLWTPNGFSWNLTFQLGTFCSGPPDAGTSTLITGPPYCVDATVTMGNNANNSASQIDYRWLTGPMGGPYTPVPFGNGSNTQSYTATMLPVGTHHFVMRATCLMTNESSLSNVVTVVVESLPNVSVPTSVQGCEDEWLQLCATSTNATMFTWAGPNNFEGDLSCYGRYATLDDSGIYTVTVSNGPGTCSNAASVFAQVYGAPTPVQNERHLAVCQFAGPGSGTLYAQGIDMSTTVSATWNGGHLPTSFASYSPSCNGAATPLTVNIPPGNVVTRVDVTYTFQALGSPATAWLSEQRSRLRCAQTGQAENGPLGGYYACYSPGSGVLGGCPEAPGGVTYSRTGLNIANGPSPTGVLTFELEAFRTFNGTPGGCGTDQQRINNGTWTVTVFHQSPGTSTVEWYAAPTGGIPIWLGENFDPIGYGLFNTLTPGIYTAYAGNVMNGCRSERTPVHLYVGDESLALEFNTGGSPADLFWSIHDALTQDELLLGNGALLPPYATVQENICLPAGRGYTLRVNNVGDGGSGYMLRHGTSQARMIDNRNNLGIGLSAITGNAYSFSLPMGTNALMHSSCDKGWWRTGEYMVAVEDPDVSAQFSLTPTTSGYEFWIFNPNGGYSYRRFRNHATSDGFSPNNAVRACHMKINNWTAANHIPEHDLLNVRVRARVAGVNKAWGPACRFVRNEALALCPPTKLMDIPGNQFISCGQFRQFVSKQRIHARPVSGANLYQWRFRIEAENVEIVRTSTTYFLNLGWSAGVAAPLLNSKTYEVDVRASRDGGLTWCGLDDPWGDVCLLTIGTPPAVGGNQNMSLSADGVLAIWPNPNTGDLLWISLSEVAQDVETVAVDIHDLVGQRIMTRMLPVQSHNVNTPLELPGNLATGVYTVTIVAGTARHTQRLVIQR